MTEVLEEHEWTPAKKLWARWSHLARQTPNLLVDGNPVAIVWDEMIPGLARPWFECPVCKRRAQHLYLRQMACRRCSKLNYSSWHLHRSVPGYNRILHMRRRLGIDLVPFSAIAPRPKSTHSFSSRR